MVATEPVVLWRVGQVACIVVHHWAAHSYEVQIVEPGRVITRRWFDRSDAAAAFATDQALEFGATDVGLVP
jgi:hypothetical protein